MNLRLKYLLVLTLVWSVFSFSLQASITHFCKENKMIKNQDSSNPFSEEESPDDSDEETDEKKDFIYFEEYLKKKSYSFKTVSNWDYLEDKIIYSYLKISVPPPKA